MSLSKKDIKLISNLKELYPGAGEEFILEIFHNIRGRQVIFRLNDLNDDSNPDVKFFDMSD